MYRYLVFAYAGYYPSGGMNDCVFKTNDFDEAFKFADDAVNKSRVWRGVTLSPEYDLAHVYDVKEDKIITIEDK